MLALGTVFNRVGWFSFMLFISFAGTVLAAEPAVSAAELEAQIDRLIDQLGDANVQVRDDATGQLSKIGVAALAKLSAAANDTDPERRKRAEEIVKVVTRAAVGLQFVSQIKSDGLRGAVTLVMSPDNEFVYVPGHVAATINVFRRDSKTGSLTDVQAYGDREQLDGVVTLRLSSKGDYAVASACRSKSIALFARDENTGELTLVSMRRHQPGGELNMEWPIDAIFSMDDKFVYAVDDRRGTVLVFQVGNGPQLNLVEIFPGQDACFAGVRGITANPDGKMLYVTSNRAGTLVVLDRDATTGKVGIHQILRDEQDGIHGLAGVIETHVSRDGKYVYAVSGRFIGDNAISAFQVGDDGKLTLLQEFINEESELKHFMGGANGITISPDGTRLYASGAKSQSLACFARDPKTGRLTYLTTLRSLGTGQDADLGANGVEVSRDGKFLYLALENSSAISVFQRTATAPKP